MRGVGLNSVSKVDAGAIYADSYFLSLNEVYIFTTSEFKVGL